MFGVPSVAAHAGAVSEVVEDGATGLLVAPGDVEALRAAIGRLRDDGDLRRRLGEAARSRALERFSDTAMTRGYTAVFVGGKRGKRTIVDQISGRRS
jgi:glycosyltransferase involved in cell wall biosynthesis